MAISAVVRLCVPNKYEVSQVPRDPGNITMAPEYRIVTRKHLIRHPLHRVGTTLDLLIGISLIILSLCAIFKVLPWSKGAIVGSAAGGLVSVIAAVAFWKYWRLSFRSFLRALPTF